MKQFPRNVKTGPCRISLCEADDAEDLFDEEESYSVTPPPVAITSTGQSSDRQQEIQASCPNRSTYGWLLWTAVVIGFAIALGIGWNQSPPKQKAVALRAWVMPALEPAALLRTQHQLDLSNLTRHRRADANIQHDGYAPIPGGVLYTPKSFSSSDGSYDLLLHFHGNVKVVVESAVVAKLNAAIAVVNLGVGSARYQDFYAAPGMYEDLLDQIQAGMRRRGLESPRLRRIALSAWSAGYGAISTVLTQRLGTDPLDAILILDGIHTGYDPTRPGTLVERRLAPFEEAAHASASGDLLFSITYSEIDPPGYAGSRATAEHLLALSKTHGEVEKKPLTTPVYFKLESMRGAVAKEDAHYLEPIDDQSVGTFRIRGYRGNTRGHHMAHLFQMGATVLPELAQRWDAYSGYAGRADAVHAARVRMRARSRSGTP